MDERDEPPQTSRTTPAVHATVSFFSGFAIQIASLTGRLITYEEHQDPWFARGEWAAYGFLALVAVLALALLASQL